MTFDTYSPEPGDELMVALPFSLDKDPDRSEPQFQPGEAFDWQALGVSLHRLRDFLNKGRLELLSKNPRADIDVKDIDEEEEALEEVEAAAPPAQSAEPEADS